MLKVWRNFMMGFFWAVWVVFFDMYHWILKLVCSQRMIRMTLEYGPIQKGFSQPKKNNSSYMASSSRWSRASHSLASRSTSNTSKWHEYFTSSRDSKLPSCSKSPKTVTTFSLRLRSSWLDCNLASRKMPGWLHSVTWNSILFQINNI